MEENRSKVYVLVDGKNRIVRCEGGYTMNNIGDVSQWVLIGEGLGDRFNLCQSHYFDGGLFTDEGIPKYKLVDGQPLARTEEELEADRLPAKDPEPTIEERVGTLEEDSAQTREALEMILNGVVE